MLEPLQDITYTYDPVGNVTYVENPLSDVVDNAGQTVSPDFDYTYDALYRLKESQGREHPGIGQQGQEHQNNFGVFWDKTPVSDPSKITSYTESYSYDPSNNLETIDHHHGTINHPGTQIWKRTNTIAENSNRLSRSGLGGGQPTDINYDANGNQTDMAGKPLLWNYRDNIASAGMIPRTTDGPNVEYYVYDAGGSRVRKVNANQTNDAGSSTSEVVYLGNFEIRRDGTGASESEWHSIRYSDGKGVFCELRYQTQGDVPPDETNHQTCYQLTNLINSIGMEVDGTGAFISYEEYYPYGGTSFIAGKNQPTVKSRHYRYSGKEQDRSGLYYYGRRYYCSWTGRWMSADPVGTVDGLNLYRFVKGNPVTHLDVGGMLTDTEIENLSSHTRAADNYARALVPFGAGNISSWPRGEGEMEQAVTRAHLQGQRRDANGGWGDTRNTLRTVIGTGGGMCQDLAACALEHLARIGEQPPGRATPIMVSRVISEKGKHSFVVIHDNTDLDPHSANLLSADPNKRQQMVVVDPWMPGVDNRGLRLPMHSMGADELKIVNSVRLGSRSLQDHIYDMTEGRRQNPHEEGVVSAMLLAQPAPEQNMFTDRGSTTRPATLSEGRALQRTQARLRVDPELQQAAQNHPPVFGHYMPFAPHHMGGGGVIPGENFHPGAYDDAV